jgi:hypothetical protein
MMEMNSEFQELQAGMPALPGVFSEQLHEHKLTQDDELDFGVLGTIQSVHIFP